MQETQIQVQEIAPSSQDEPLIQEPKNQMPACTDTDSHPNKDRQPSANDHLQTKTNNHL